MSFYQEAIRQFRTIYQKAQSRKLKEPTSVALATANSQGRPSVRMVLLKELDGRGFVFYTNLKSRKGRDLQKNPWAALCFYWDPMDDQIRVEGRVRKVSDQEADRYWATRPRDSQIGAWASLQSQDLASRAMLLKRVAHFVIKFGTRPIPRPPDWSGFRVEPHRIEFWRRRQFRLHDRIVYEKVSGKWRRRRLYP